MFLFCRTLAVLRVSRFLHKKNGDGQIRHIYNLDWIWQNVMIFKDMEWDWVANEHNTLQRNDETIKQFSIIITQEYKSQLYFSPSLLCILFSKNYLPERLIKR